jgi:hypothetical protein
VADAATIESARREWAEADDALAREPDAERRRALTEQVEVVLAELRRRVGQTFTLSELADAYAEADRWSREALAEADAPAWWPRTLTIVQAAAFARYELGAIDYAP